MSLTVCRLLVVSVAVASSSNAIAQEVPPAVLVSSAAAGAAPEGTLPGAAAAQGTAPVQTARAKVRGYSIVLLVGEVQGRDKPPASGPSGEIPAAVQKALTSVQAFLPYKSYRLYDAALLPVPSASSALMRSDIYGLCIRAELTPRSVGGPATPGSLVNVVLSEIWSGSSGTKPSGEPRVNTLLNASVWITAGETVVVGTSQVGGNTGVIALLTAIPE
jgi:hypothetical protein